MEFVKPFQVSDGRYLQEIEAIFTGITKIGDVAIKREAPVIVFADTAVKKQVVPPSKRTCSLYRLTGMGTSLSQKKTDVPFRSANLMRLIVFRSCAASVSPWARQRCPHVFRSCIWLVVL